MSKLKKCIKCGKEKFENAIYFKPKDRSRHYGITCIDCLKRGKKHRKKPSEKYFNLMGDEKFEFEEKLIIEYDENVCKILEENRKKNKEERNAVLNGYQQKRRSLKMELPSTLKKQEWDEIKRAFKGRCAYCGEIKKLEQEHFVSLTRKGEYTHNNIVPACKSCNCSKGNKNFNEWYPKYKYYSKKREKFVLNHLNYKNGNQQLSLF